MITLIEFYNVYKLADVKKMLFEFAETLNIKTYCQSPKAKVVTNFVQMQVTYLLCSHYLMQTVKFLQSAKNKPPALAPTGISKLGQVCGIGVQTAGPGCNVNHTHGCQHTNDVDV